MARITIDQAAALKYENEEVREAVLKDAKDKGTVERIEGGELVLPSEQDANHWHARITGKPMAGSDRAKDLARVAELEKQVAALSAGGGPPSSDYIKKLEERIRSLEGKGGK